MLIISLRFKRILIILFLIVMFVISTLGVNLIDFSIFDSILSVIIMGVLGGFSVSSFILLMIIAGYYVFKP